MAIQIQLRRDTSIDWASANPILTQGEVGIETDTDQFKIGDGSTTWSGLAYFSGAGVVDHGGLTGLGDDDHTIYSLVDGTRAFSGTVSGVAPTENLHLATKKYVDDQDSTLDAATLASAQSYTDTTSGVLTAEIDSDIATFSGTIDHDTIVNNHNLTTDIDHDQLTNYSVDQHRTINDSGVAVTDLWSAEKISSEITTISGKLDDHNELNNLDYASAGHTGFQPAGDYVTDAEMTTISGDISAEIDSDITTHISADDHTQYLLTNGTRQLSGTWNYGSDTISGTGDFQTAGKINLTDGTDTSIIKHVQETGLGGRLTIGLDETARTMIICDAGDVDVDFGLTVLDNPGLYIYNAAGTSTSRFSASTIYTSTENFGIEAKSHWFKANTDLDSANMVTFYSSASIELTDTNGEQSWVYIEPKINQTGTAAYNALKIDVASKVSTGDGSTGDGNNLINACVSGTSLFRVDDTGEGYFAGNVGIGVTSPTSKLHLPQENDAVTPTLAFGDGDTGFYEYADDGLGISIGGNYLWNIEAGHIGDRLGYAGLMRETASATNPVVTPNWASDNDTGIGWAAADQLSLIAGGTEQLRLTQNDAADDVAHFSGNVEFAGKIIETIVAHNVVTSGTETYNLNEGTYHSTTVSGNFTAAFSGWDVSGVTSLTMKLTNAGAHTITWDAAVKWEGSVEPFWTSAGTDFAVFFSDNNGTDIYGIRSATDMG